MGTRWSVTLDAPAGCNLALLHRNLAAAVELVDDQMSPWKPHSDLMRLNRTPVGTWVTLPPQLMEVLACALEVQRQSAGAFDPGVGALVNAWGFGAGGRTPDAAAIRSARHAPPEPTTAAGQRQHPALELDLPAGRARRCADQSFDLCGIAKGYGVDRMAAVLADHGVTHALAALDGELRAVGTQASGSPWAVALEQPDVGQRAVHGVIELEQLAVATSGDYRHFVQVGDTRLAHTLDARRGAPVNNAVASVTVLASTGMLADAWATALLVAGPGEGLALAQRVGLDALWLLRRPPGQAGTGWVELGLGRFASGTPALTRR